jgi:hypothetical protein
MKKIFILLFFIVTSCGYQPIYKADKSRIKIKVGEVEFIGNKELGREIYSTLGIKTIANNKSLEKLILDSKKNIIETSKNSKGQVISYQIFISVKLSFFDIDNNLSREKTFSKDFSYNVQENKFKFKKHQVDIENNLKNKIIEDINIYFNF